MPRHTGGRHAHRAGATGCRSLGSAWPTVSRSGHRIANARRSRGGNRGTLGEIGETPPGASRVRTPPGSPRTVAGVARRPWWPFPFVLYSCGYRRLRSRGIEQGLHLRSDRERVLCPPLCTRQPCGNVRTAHSPSERTPLSERPMPCITRRRRLDDWDGQRSTRHL